MLSFIKRKKILILVVISVLVIMYLVWGGGSNTNGDTALVIKGDLVRTVELSGKVVPTEDVDLAFETTGTTAHVYKKVGDTIFAGEIIADLDQSGARADVLKASADLDVARAELSRLEGGASIQAKLTNTKTSVIQNIVSAYTTADDSIYAKIDQFFDDPRTPNPKIRFAFNDYQLKNTVNDGRVRIGSLLLKWKTQIADLTTATYTADDLNQAKTYIAEIISFLNDVSRAVNSFEPNASLSQTSIDKYRTDVASARQNINNVADTLIAGENSLTQSLSDVPVQAARVASAEATLANAQSKFAKMALRSPISGVVAKQDAKVGESVPANSIIASVISSDYKIEAYVPEVSVAGVSLGAKAKVTLDAYGKDVAFDALISRIDPRETIRDGVSTYKIELTFNSVDSRVLSGMTANTSIEIARKQEALSIPERAVVSVNGIKKVSVKNKDGSIVEKIIESGIVDTRGNIEVISGLEEGDVVLLNP